MNSRSEFVVAAVAEAQATIRAVDVKVAALLVAALAPVPLLASIGECFSGIYKEWGGLLIGATLIVFCVSWALALICYAMAIGAISSPSTHVRNAATRSGALQAINRQDVLSVAKAAFAFYESALADAEKFFVK